MAEIGTLKVDMALDKVALAASLREAADLLDPEGAGCSNCGLLRQMAEAFVQLHDLARFVVGRNV